MRSWDGIIFGKASLPGKPQTQISPCVGLSFPVGRVLPRTPASFVFSPEVEENLGCALPS